MDFKKRLFSKLLVRSGDRVDKILNDKKVSLFSGIGGKTLEIGAGIGVNARYFSDKSNLIALEPNHYFQSYLVNKYSKVIISSAEKIDLPNNSIDNVISSLVLCSVSNESKVISEIYRILKPGGKYYLIEHIPSDKYWLKIFQRFFSPIYQFFGDGCHPERDIVKEVNKSSFNILKLEKFKADLKDSLIKDFVSGILQKPETI
ncbi:MAG TPA: methyltransferase domain-containing protein [Candidatus Paceibacterota bacterium]|nr:methyltransferase domain-containing protein [Candidatus Paceibacterota bacterium]